MISPIIHSKEKQFGINFVPIGSLPEFSAQVIYDASNNELIEEIDNIPIAHEKIPTIQQIYNFFKWLFNLFKHQPKLLAPNQAAPATTRIRTTSNNPPILDEGDEKDKEVSVNLELAQEPTYLPQSFNPLQLPQPQEEVANNLEQPAQLPPSSPQPQEEVANNLEEPAPSSPQPQEEVGDNLEQPAQWPHSKEKKYKNHGQTEETENNSHKSNHHNSWRTSDW